VTAVKNALFVFMFITPFTVYFFVFFDTVNSKAAVV
jgi:hypothetical protein